MKRFVFTAALVACAVTLLSLASAQDVSKRVLPDESKRILPTTHFQMQPAVERTPEQMDVFEATAALPGYREAPFRPTMDASLYAQLKQAAALNPSRSKPMESSPSPLAAVSTKFGGATECDDSGTGFGCWAPPDVAGSLARASLSRRAIICSRFAAELACC